MSFRYTTRMNTIGKILFFNEHDGSGLIITAERKKIKFTIEEWNDFDTMPCLGLEVGFDIKDNIATNIIFTDNLQDEDEVGFEEPEIKENIDLNLSKPIQNSNQKTDVLTETAEDILEFVEETQENLDVLTQNITLTLSIADTMHAYFNDIKKHIKLRVGYKKVDGRLEYLVAKRFIWTTFNNLSEIDSNVVTTRIKSISTDLKLMSTLYDEFSKKTKYPSIAFEDIFLSCQAEYKNIKKSTEETIERLNFLRHQEKIIGEQRKIKKEEVKRSKRKEEKIALNNELKSLNGAYVDIVHMMAELDERHKHNSKLLHSFELEYKDDFYEDFLKEAEIYKISLLEILDAQAFLIDAQLWQEAKISKAIKTYFKESSIDGELNTKTYLKYYLNSLNSAKMTEDTKKLFDLYDYLIAEQKDYTLIITSSPQDAMDYESAIKNSNKANFVKSFINEVSAIKWAMKNNIKIIVLEEMLQTTNAQKFLNAYHNNMLTKPKIILIGDKPKIHSSDYVITKTLSKNISPNIVARNVNEMLENQIN